MKIYIAADHGGFELKNKIYAILSAKGLDVTDMGPRSYDSTDDYPDYAIPAVKKVLEDPKNRGILICRNGVGVNIVADKFPGVRSVLSWDPKHAESAVEHDNTNVLALPADYINQDKALEIVTKWLKTDFSGAERHKRRLAKIEDIEK
jgi:ribose 5-phosphate isomerase B